jgi:hypothetical protein
MGDDRARTCLAWRHLSVTSGNCLTLLARGLALWLVYSVFAVSIVFVIMVFLLQRVAVVTSISGSEKLQSLVIRPARTLSRWGRTELGGWAPFLKIGMRRTGGLGIDRVFVYVGTPLLRRRARRCARQSVCVRDVDICSYK